MFMFRESYNGTVVHVCTKLEVPVSERERVAQQQTNV